MEMEHLMSSILELNEVPDIRALFGELYSQEEYIIDKTGCKTIEIIGAQFLAGEGEIFGSVNDDYIRREFEWYQSQSLNVNNFPDGAPTFWLKAAAPNGYVNSNYGWVVDNKENYNQYDNVFFELMTAPDSRRAVMIYNRPSMWVDFNKDGANDFMCTMHVHYFIRKNKLETLVYMRSNDVVFGYKNDYAWQQEIRARLFNDLSQHYPKLELGSVLWNVGSLHVYERHFYLVDYYNHTWNWHITKDEYNKWAEHNRFGDMTNYDTEKKKS